MDKTSCRAGTGDVLELEAIIDRLVRSRRQIPIEAIEAARDNRDAITPLLIRLIEDATRNLRQGLVIEDDAPFFATYLLAEFGATEAWPAVLDAASLPGEQPFDLYGDAITEDFGFILAALVGDRADALDALIADRQINPYVRWQAAEAMLYQISDGVLTRESAIERLAGHLQQAIVDRDEAAEGMILCLSRLGAKATLPLIESAFNIGLVDPQMVTLASVKRDIARGEEVFPETMKRFSRPDDLVSHLSNWAAFQDGNVDDGGSTFYDSAAISDDLFEADVHVSNNETTIRNEGVKIGRNEMCPCGSGQKYKKCCRRR